MEIFESKEISPKPWHQKLAKIYKIFVVATVGIFILATIITIKTSGLLIVKEILHTFAALMLMFAIIGILLGIWWIILELTIGKAFEGNFLNPTLKQYLFGLTFIILAYIISKSSALSPDIKDILLSLEKIAAIIVIVRLLGLLIESGWLYVQKKYIDLSKPGTQEKFDSINMCIYISLALVAIISCAIMIFQFATQGIAPGTLTTLMILLLPLWIITQVTTGLGLPAQDSSSEDEINQIEEDYGIDVIKSYQAQREKICLIQLSGMLYGLKKEASEMEEKLLKGGCKNFILDFEHVLMVTELQPGVLLHINDQLKNRGGKIVIIKINPKVKGIFELLEVDSFFPFFSNKMEALHHFGYKPELSHCMIPPRSGWKPEVVDIFQKIRKILGEWDPLASFNPDDEYDNYIPDIYQLMQNPNPNNIDKLASYLNELESEFCSTANLEQNHCTAKMLMELF